ncbi:MAG: AAA family ATPase, partial [Bacteroidota bacterium]|nr:AAA family ATPase [Bacteroidota bacterium]
MFTRSAIQELVKWAAKTDRKPLIIRGARQVGKTTLVRQFAEQFDQFIYLNLEIAEDRAPFENFSTIETLLQAIFFLKNLTLEKREQTLIF